MRFRIISLAVIGGLLFAGSLLAKPYDPDRSAPQTDRKVRNELTPDEQLLFRKHMEHKQMAREFRHEAKRHRDLARLHKREFREQRFGAGNRPDCPVGPGMRREHRREMRQEMFRGPGMNPDCPKGPPPFGRERMHLRQERFGPGMNPDCSMQPPHMRNRSGIPCPRAQ